MKVEKLALSILKSDKLDTEELVKHLASAIDENIECSEEYKELYEEAYGNKLSPEIMTDWVKCMAVTDNSDRESGQKWTVDQCYEVGQKLNIDFAKITKHEWYTVMNMVYSDNYKTAKALNMAEDAMFYGRLAKDWINDEDIDNKLFKYYFYLAS